MRNESADEFLTRARIADLITLDSRGLPVPVPVWFEWDGHRARMFSSASSGKVRRAQSDARAWLVIHAEAGEPEDWVVLHGELTVLAGGWEIAARLAPRYWDVSTPASQRTLALWEAEAASLVALELVPTRLSRIAPEE